MNSGSLIAHGPVLFNRNSQTVNIGFWWQWSVGTQRCMNFSIHARIDYVLFMSRCFLTCRLPDLKAQAGKRCNLADQYFKFGMLKNFELYFTYKS